jgi:tRNA A-37 threonylcarbamoyl transferase component Bud32/dienelactone hydrolase
MRDLVDRLRGALADRYLIERELGRGGMATVYLADDLKHRRQVAIKVFRPELAATLGTERFVREIEIAAKLSHPHILPLHDSGEAGGFFYYVMPFVAGETLRDRLNREGQLAIGDALQIARDVAAALYYAHGQGVVHRDIKPENVLLSAGEAVVADFGIAWAVSEAAVERLTETGISIGTPAYMSPEQASGDRHVDGRTDIYALGCVLYEMLSGDPPYTASTPQAILLQKLTAPIPRISAMRETVPAAVEAALTKALARAPEDRYGSADEFARELTRPPGATTLRTAAVRALGRPRLAVPAIAAMLALGVISIRFVQHRADVRWAREVALPEIERLIAENDVWRNLIPPYRLAEQAEAILGGDPQLANLISQVSLTIDVVTELPGASVYMKEYAAPDSAWEFLGATPLTAVRVPVGIFRWRLEREGYETVLAAASTWRMASSEGGKPGTIMPNHLVRTLDSAGGVPAGMVRVAATQTESGALPDFFIGRYEVTNREYKAFVDAGGYRNRELWKHPFLEDGREITWEAAMREFVDPSGQPGPSTWLGGDYPEGQGDYPVSGVSWHEAAAYAEYAGMGLPTSAHWNVARGGLEPMVQVYQLGGFAVLAPFANFGGDGAVPVGSLQGVTAYGAYDMAGNVREWCWNETPVGRVVRGGAWLDNTYEFGHERQAPAMDRSPRNGFRLAYYPHPDTIPDDAFAPKQLFLPVDLRALAPVTDAVFQAYKGQFEYDRTDLNAQVEYREQSPGGWIREKVAFDAVYGGERILAYLFLPANVPPPYQAVIYFPGSAATEMTTSEELESYYEFSMFLSFVVRNGRAVLFPVYPGTFERSDPVQRALHLGADSHAYTDFLVEVVKDLRRSIDYLETRPDIDSGKLAFYGMSWGGRLGSVILAVDDRFAAGVLVGAGLDLRGLPEAHSNNYVTRVRTPTLMLNGRYDAGIDRRIRPMFDLLGTPAQHKRMILYETDHIPPRAEYIRETLAWLDKYLGPITK